MESQPSAGDAFGFGGADSLSEDFVSQGATITGGSSGQAAHVSLNQTVRHLIDATFRRIVVPSVKSSANETSVRMSVNQITFAILISVLLVADLFLVWSLGYIVVFYERRCRVAIKHFGAVRLHRRATLSD